MDLASCVGWPRGVRGATDHFSSSNLAGNRSAFRDALCYEENLKIDFRLEGNPFSYLTVRNLHAVLTGPSAIESVDINSLYVDYSLLGFARHGVSHLLKDVEVRGAQVVLNPARAPLPKPRPKKKQGPQVA